MSIRRFHESAENFKDLTNPVPKAKKKGSHYHAIELGSEAREQLLKAVPPRYGNVHVKHITLNFKPTDEDEKHFDTLEGKPVSFEVTHSAHDDSIGAHAVRVAGLGDYWHSKKPNMHVTISTDTKDGKPVGPVKSNDVLGKTEGTPLKEPLKLTGKFTRLQK